MNCRSAAWLGIPLVLAAACSREFTGGGDLRAKKVVLQREVQGLRELVGGLERGESILPPNDVAVAIDDGLVRDLIAAQLPFELDVDRFHAELKEAQVQFRGSPVVRLRGVVRLKEHADVEAAITALGAIEQIQIDGASGTLRARIAIDHIGLEKAAGLETLVSRTALDELARTIRLQLKDQLPAIQIPVKVSQQIELPAITSGPVRLEGARMPIEVAVSRVMATQGRLWIAIRFKPGDLVKTNDAPEAGDTRAADVGASLDGPGAAGAKDAAKQEGGRR